MFLVSAILTTIFIYILQKLWSLRRNEYWQKRGVPGPKPSFIFGNIKDVVFLQKSTGQVCNEIYKQYKDYPYVGVYSMGDPCILVRNPHLVRQIVVKDFVYFSDNQFEVNEAADPLMGRNPFVLKGEKWKDTRTQLLPVFSTENVKSIIPNLEVVSKRLVNYISKSDSGVFEAKDLTSRFTTDNVFSILYSMDSKSFHDQDAYYWKMTRKMFSPTLSLGVKNIFWILFPWFATILKFALFPRDLSNALIKLTSETKEHRRKTNVSKNDFLDVMGKLRHKKTGYKFSDLDIAAHSAGFVTDGLETTATALSYLLYELASSPKIQEKVYQEIVSVLESHGNEVSYEAIQEMSYLDCACHETLRKHPVSLQNIRLCTKPYTIESPLNDGTQVTIEKDIPVIIPTYALHMDPKLFPNPEVFDPERFFPENKSNIIRGSYLGFWDGPRACLGQRIGLAQVKIGIIYILNNFRVELDERMKTPLEIDPMGFLMAAKGGLWIKFVERKFQFIKFGVVVCS